MNIDAAADAWGTLLAYNLLLDIPIPPLNPDILLPPGDTSPALQAPTPEDQVTQDLKYSSASLSDSQNAAKPIKDVCKFFLSNSCRRGAKCKFRHTSE
jgi:hypothetical protein